MNSGYVLHRLRNLHNYTCTHKYLCARWILTAISARLNIYQESFQQPSELSGNQTKPEPQIRVLKEENNSLISTNTFQTCTRHMTNVYYLRYLSAKVILLYLVYTNLFKVSCDQFKLYCVLC